MNAIIFHGTGSHPGHFWFPWLKRTLELKGCDVWLPQLPAAEKPDIAIWLPFALDNGKYDRETILVGHSAGCPLILSVLENLDGKVSKAILVAAFARPLTPDNVDPLLQTEYQWDRIRDNVDALTVINSDNDPWGCNEQQGKYIADNASGELIIRHGEGHMGSETFNQPYREFPLLLELIERKGN